jgi:hypothetical protein
VTVDAFPIVATGLAIYIIAAVIGDRRKSAWWAAFAYATAQACVGLLIASRVAGDTPPWVLHLMIAAYQVFACYEFDAFARRLARKAQKQPNAWAKYAAKVYDR